MEKDNQLPQPETSNRRIDLNHASRDELMRIPGISPEAADRLIECRDEKAPAPKGERPAPRARSEKREQAEDELVDRLYV